MAVAEKHGEWTALRELEISTRNLALDGQMSACIDLLQSPDFAVDDLVQSVTQIRESVATPTREQLLSNLESDESTFFYPSRELFVQGDGCSFTCLATEIEFLDGEGDGSPRTQDVQNADRIDYAAVTCESRPFPVLGFTQSAESESAYPLLLRSLSSLIELTRGRRFDLLDRDIYRGILGPAPAFDLALVLWDEDAEDGRRPLCELTRDLAEVLKASLAAERRFPPVLNHIICLRMNPKRFDGRLRFVWRV